MIKFGNWNVVIKTSFTTRVFTTIVLVILGTGYVLTPQEYQIFILIPYIIFLILHPIVYFRYFRRTFDLLFTKKTIETTQFSTFSPDIEMIFQKFSNKLVKNIKIVFSNSIDDFESKSSQKTIYVNPNYVQHADPQEIEASLYHELGHIKKFSNYILDQIIFFNIPLFYWMIFTTISLARGELPIIPAISMFLLIRLMMTFLSWRNEYRADQFATENVSLDAMGKMFGTMKQKSSVESHPSPSKRWSKISKKATA